MRWYLLIAFILFSAGIALTGHAAAHPGGLNSEGCHNNRKTGDYHCHRGNGGSSSSKSPSYGLVSSGRSFRNCTEARAAGAAPVRAGDPGYGVHLDRDRDGVGCE